MHVASIKRRLGALDGGCVCSAFRILESHARLGADAAPADAALGACLSRVKDHAPRLLRAEATTVRLQGRPSQLASPIA